MNNFKFHVGFEEIEEIGRINGKMILRCWYDFVKNHETMNLTMVRRGMNLFKNKK